MTPEAFAALSSSGLLPATYAQQASEARRGLEARVTHLVTQRKLPSDGWSDDDIEQLLRDLSRMDSNNFTFNCGVGEREARVFSGLVSRRHFGLAHGIGRSGELTEVQPKAAGSSALNKLTNALVLDLLRELGVRATAHCFVAPVATGMALTLCMLALRRVRPAAKYVVWSRIDQKSCFKSILAAGYEPLIVQLSRIGDELQTNLAELERVLDSVEASSIACVMTTTSCFAPRAADDLPAVSRLCKARNIPTLVNNAYGVQSSKCMHLLEESAKSAGKYDAFVQSADKNFMVPVGGAIIAGFNKDWINQISQTYPGRASASPSIDLFITLMSLGVNGYRKLVKERKENFALLKTEMRKIAEKYGEEILESRGNSISLAMTLRNVEDACGDGASISQVGAMLFTRGVSGTRVLTGRENKALEGHHFQCWGSHHPEMNTAYLTAAAAIGMTQTDIDEFVRKLDKVLAAKSRASHDEKKSNSSGYES